MSGDPKETISCLITVLSKEVEFYGDEDAGIEEGPEDDEGEEPDSFEYDFQHSITFDGDRYQLFNNHEDEHFRVDQQFPVT